MSNKITVEMSMEELSLVCGLLGVTAGYTLKPLFTSMLGKLDDRGMDIYQEMVHEAYKCLADETELDEDLILSNI